MVEQPHLPRQALIDTHGNGGFRFAGMSHRGSLLCLPDGIWAWPIANTTLSTPSWKGDPPLVSSTSSTTS